VVADSYARDNDSSFGVAAMGVLQGFFGTKKKIRQSVQDIREGHKVQASWKNGAKKEVLKGKVVGYEDDGDGEVKLKIKWNKDRTTTSHGLDMDGLESLETMEVPALVDCEYHLVVFIKLLVGGAEVVRACCLCCRHKH